MSRQASKRYRGIIRNRKRRIARRLRRKPYEDRPQAVMAAGNIHYEMGEKIQGITCGGIGAIHQMVGRVGLADLINEELRLLKTHVPYYESDHVLNIAYNVLLGGVRLEDIELRRQDEVFLNALGAERIPDPTTAGDFTRRFSPATIGVLLDCINAARRRVWRQRAGTLLREALIDVDGALAETYGECKGGLDISHQGIWGYHPLIVSLANTKEVLYLVNRSGNVPSHSGAAEWIDRAIELVEPHTRRITVRGDTDFSLTAHFDRWAERVDFLFGMDAHVAVVRRADALAAADWAELRRQPTYRVKTHPRRRPANVKQGIVKRRGYKNIRLASEQVAEFRHRPTKCQQAYRVVVVRKNLSIERGEQVLFDDIRYFFYITTREDLSAAEVVALAHGRCDQENVIAQLKTGVNALRMPVDNLVSNWAYMVMAALAWNLKAWLALLVRFRKRRQELLRMEFRRFQQAMIWIPAQIVRQGRRIIYRLLSYNAWLKDFFSAWQLIRRMKFT